MNNTNIEPLESNRFVTNISEITNIIGKTTLSSQTEYVEEVEDGRIKCIVFPMYFEIKRETSSVLEEFYIDRTQSNVCNFECKVTNLRTNQYVWFKGIILDNNIFVQEL